MPETAYVYILASGFKHLYVGVISNLERRSFQHILPNLPRQLHGALQHQAPGLLRAVRHDSIRYRKREADQALVPHQKAPLDRGRKSDVARSQRRLGQTHSSIQRHQHLSCFKALSSDQIHHQAVHLDRAAPTNSSSRPKAQSAVVENGVPGELARWGAETPVFRTRRKFAGHSDPRAAGRPKQSTRPVISTEGANAAVENGSPASLLAGAQRPLLFASAESARDA